MQKHVREDNTAELLIDSKVSDQAEAGKLLAAASLGIAMVKVLDQSAINPGLAGEGIGTRCMISPTLQLALVSQRYLRRKGLDVLL